MNKRLIDISQIICVTVCIITGFVLHNEVHHLHLYDNEGLWYAHEIFGLILAVAIGFHCIQHRMWFKSYDKIPAKKKLASTILFATAFAVIISGCVLMCGSHSHFISILHYVTAIMFTLLALGHVIKRWKIFISLKRQH